MTQVIYPTQTCFDDALDLLVALCHQDRRRRRALRLVHAVVAPDGAPCAHAWVDDATQVFFQGLVDGAKHTFESSRAEYYTGITVRECTRYTLQQALLHNRRTGHYGPWQARYRALCLGGDPHAQ